LQAICTSHIMHLACGSRTCQAPHGCRICKNQFRPDVD
jgi:hypothetical protein